MPKTITWRVDGLHDEIHGNVIEQSLKAVQGVQSVTVSFTERLVNIEYGEDIDASALKQALLELQKIGYQFQLQGQEQATQQHVEMVQSKKNRKIGLWFLIGPWVGLVLVLIAWAVVAFTVARMAPPPSVGVDAAGGLALAPADGRAAAAQIVNVALGFLGIVFVLLGLVGVPLGIAFLVKRVPSDPSKCDSRSGMGKDSIVPPEIGGWNWAAFSLSIIWGICNSVWISLLCLIPLVGFFVSLYLGIKGNELAWKKQKWISVEDFKQTQKKWQPWGIVFFILWILSTAGNSVSKYQQKTAVNNAILNDLRNNPPGLSTSTRSGR